MRERPREARTTLLTCCHVIPLSLGPNNRPGGQGQYYNLSATGEGTGGFYTSSKKLSSATKESPPKSVNEKHLTLRNR